MASQVPSASAQSPDDRATSFQPVTGEPEHYRGETLLVSAYALVWVIVLGWVGLLWRRQSALSARLGDLERVLGEAAARKDAK